MKEISLTTLLYMLKEGEWKASGIAEDMLEAKYGKDAAHILKAMVRRKDGPEGSSGDSPDIPPEVALEAESVRDAESVPMSSVMEMYRSGDEDLVKEAQTWAVRKYEMYVYDLIHHSYPTYADKMMAELYQSGIEGILRALPSYDEEKGEFTTHCKSYVMHELNRQVNFYHNDSTPHHYSVQKQIRAAIDRLEKEGLEATPKRIQIITGFSTEMIDKELEYINRVNFFYLDDDGDEGLKEVEDVMSRNPEAVAMEEEQIAELRKAVSELDEPERSAVRMKFFEGKTNQEIGKIMGVSVAKAKSICNDGLRTLKKSGKLDRAYEYMTRLESEMRQNSVSVMPSSKAGGEELADLDLLSDDEDEFTEEGIGAGLFFPDDGDDG